MTDIPASLSADWRTTYPFHNTRELMLGHLNVGAGPFTIPAATALPWVFIDPRISMQSIVLFVSHDAASAAKLAGHWVVIGDGRVTLDLPAAPTAPMVVSYVVLG